MSTTGLDAIGAHGDGELADLNAPESQREHLRRYAEELPVAVLSQRYLADLEMLASGAFTPLTGFMGQLD